MLCKYPPRSHREPVALPPAQMLPGARSLRAPGTGQEGQLGPFSAKEGEASEQRKVVLQKSDGLEGWTDGVVTATEEKGTGLVFLRK